MKGGFIPTSLAAHPDGSVVLALGEKGLLQCFDIALSPVQLAFPNEEQLTGNILDIRQGSSSTVSKSCIPSSGSTFTVCSPLFLYFCFLLLVVRLDFFSSCFCKRQPRLVNLFSLSLFMNNHLSYIEKRDR